MRFFLLIVWPISSLFGCKSIHSLPKAMEGHWESEQANLQIRKKTGFLHYQFRADQVSVFITIDSTHAISGKIGNAIVARGHWVANQSLHSNDTSSIIAVGKITLNGNISPQLGKHENLELWALPIHDYSSWKIEIRERHGLDATPVGCIIMKKQT